MLRPPFPSAWTAIPMSPANLTLANTLPVGQTFLWHRHPLPPAPLSPLEEYSRAIDNPPRVICLRQSFTHIYYTVLYRDPGSRSLDLENNLTKQWIDDYFQLKTHPDLEALYTKWRLRDPELFGRVEVDSRAVGVRVLRQDPWECLVSFITSTNNHIPRITSLLHRFSQTFGEPVLSSSAEPGFKPVTYHLFPDPHLVPTSLESTLRELGFGYRASFIESSLESLRDRFGCQKGAIEAGLDEWRSMEIGEVREYLTLLKGVGRKVADCVMLMCLDKPSVIPIDTHMSNIAARHPSFPSRLKNKTMSKAVYDETQQFLVEKWGSMGGWCQAVMFAADLPQPRVKVEKVTVKIEKVVAGTLTEKAVIGGKRTPPETVVEQRVMKRTRSASRR